ncbi:MAG: zinc dependent phospholipase C family protein [Clostridia bacterium]|nr:zinc dependent phospholipase C family protein [Clostridia bacterium]
MGSIAMHLCVANEVNKIFNLDMNSFLIGNIAPDIYKNITNERISTHYIEKYIINDKKYELPNLGKYVNDNIQTIKNDAYIVGYYSHLIADKIWYMDVVNKYTEVLSNDKTMVKLYNQDKFIFYQQFKNGVYEDYTNSNKYLLQKYGVNIEKLHNIPVLNILDDEFTNLMNEFVCNNIMNIKLVKFNILTVKEMEDWIEVSKNEVIKELCKILDKNGKN